MLEAGRWPYRTNVPIVNARVSHVRRAEVRSLGVPPDVQARVRAKRPGAAKATSMNKLYIRATVVY